MVSQINEAVNEKIDRLIKFLGFGKNHIFGAHESSRKIVYHQKNFSAFLEGRDRDILPICVELVPSINCNFNCPSCTYTQNGSKRLAIISNRKGETGLMDYETFRFVSSGLRALEVKSVIITGGGEPSMNPLYLSFMKELKSSGFYVGLYSNAGGLDEDIRAILEAEPAFVRLSLNSGDAATHFKMYGVRNMFERVIKNIINIGKSKTTLPNCRTTLGIGFILGQRNSCDEQLDSIARTLEYIVNESCGGISYAAFRPEVQYFTENSSTGTPEVCKQQPNQHIFIGMSDKIEERIKKRLEKTGLKVLIAKDGFEQLSLPYKDGRNIAAPWSISINYDGQPYFISEGNGNPDYRISSDRYESLEISWKSQRRREVEEKITSSPSTPGHFSLLPHYKLLTTNNLLLAIRESFGVLTHEEVKHFYSKLDLTKSPEHVNFI